MSVYVLVCGICMVCLCLSVSVFTCAFMCLWICVRVYESLHEGQVGGNSRPCSQGSCPPWCSGLALAPLVAAIITPPPT